VTFFLTQPQFGLNRALAASVGDRTYNVMMAEEGACFGIADQRDFDGDGYTDVLLTTYTGCGGNCCPLGYSFVSYVGDGHFRRTEIFGYSWSDPEIEPWGNQTTVVITSNNEGMNVDDPEEKRTRYILSGGQTVKVEESTRMYLEALAELHVRDIAAVARNAWPTLVFDLDQDGIDDVIRVTDLWERWGRMYWSVQLSAKGTFDVDIPCKRIGVLASATLGIHDLVCDQDQVLTWNGAGFRASSR
jgi:hypothetical protein